MKVEVFCLVFTLLLSGVFPCRAGAQRVSISIPRAALVPQRAVSNGRNDLVYLGRATEPYEAVPLGNGRVGVMVRNAPDLNYLFNPGNFFASDAEDDALLSAGECALNLPPIGVRALWSSV